MKTEKLNEIAGMPVIVKRINSALLGTEIRAGKEQPEDLLSGPQTTKVDVDFADYKHPAITALIPAIKIGDKLVSMSNGKVIEIGEGDRIEPITVGTALFFPDGTRVVYTRGWYKGQYKFFFAENKCKESSTAPNIHVFGEE